MLKREHKNLLSEDAPCIAVTEHWRRLHIHQQRIERKLLLAVDVESYNANVVVTSKLTAFSSQA